MTMPNFLLIGANKAGTTSMHWYLEQHPEIYLSPIKEPMYFTLMSTVVDENNPIYHNKNIEVVDNIDDYLALFDGVTTEKAIGELSTSYLYNPDAANNIKQAIPNVKLMAILRNPVERAYSNYLMHLRWGIEDRLDFTEVIEAEEQYLGDFGSQEWTYLKYSFYAQPLQYYYKLFEVDQIKIFLFEELEKEPVSLVRSMYRFLEVDASLIPDVSNKANVSAKLQGKAPKPPFPDELRAHLIEIFREDVLILQELIQRDLSSWLQMPQTKITPVTAKAKPTAPARLLAFYLPQYHPTPENDEWWGAGFTDWHNVKKAKPLFPNHHQPHVPTELGYYNLCNPAVRQTQADLAKAHGIHGFCYYHYWFNTKRLLDRPFSEVLVSDQPDFPFCLCWANENWTRAWDGRHNDILIQQNYNPSDDLSHIRHLIDTFRDERYIRIDGKALFLVYRVSLLPRPLETTSIWREEAAREGLELYLCSVESLAADRTDPTQFGFDAAIDFQPDWFNLGSPIRRVGQQNAVYDYEYVVKNMLKRPKPTYKQFPCVTPSWDNTARRQKKATVLHNATPDLYQYWLEQVLQDLSQPENKLRHPDEKLVFINAWNEWAEGAHLEPDQKWGRAYLEATKQALANNQNPKQVAAQLRQDTSEPEVDEQTLNDIMSLYLPSIRF